MRYPYLFIDQTQHGHVTRYRLFTEIFEPYHIAFSIDGMKGYIVNEKDFLANFNILYKTGINVVATVKNENEKRKNDNGQTDYGTPEEKKGAEVKDISSKIETKSNSSKTTCYNSKLKELRGKWKEKQRIRRRLK